MFLKAKSLLPWSSSYRAVKKLYMDAFPKNERLPYIFLLANSLRPLASCYAYYDKKQFVGFTYILESREYERNGYQLTSHYYFEGQESCQVLTTDQNVDLEHFQKLVKRAVLGLVSIIVR
ncbi:hypothetical protein ACVR0S_09380 [Streptococcus dentapri]|uniref:GNAT family acetyltransferase n=1 Tax=Streptococcus dentapri TaxID=573564 RepID=A0ABV8D2V7_9STRE